jgi:hypothetical protein
LNDFKFHDLRKTFSSVLAQNGVSTAVTQKLLEHSSLDLTNKVYMNVDPVLRHAVDQISVDDWLLAHSTRAPDHPCLHQYGTRLTDHESVAQTTDELTIIADNNSFGYCYQRRCVLTSDEPS